jgi:hypothetical protein
MALKISTTYNGLKCDYWKILGLTQDALANKTTVIMGLYYNREQRDASPTGFLTRQTVQVDGVDITRATVYAILVQSKPEIVTPEVPEVKDEEGKVTQEFVPAVTKETNPWALAENV